MKFYKKYTLLPSDVMGDNMTRKEVITTFTYKTSSLACVTHRSADCFVVRQILFYDKICLTSQLNMKPNINLLIKPSNNYVGMITMQVRSTICPNYKQR